MPHLLTRLRERVCGSQEPEGRSTRHTYRAAGKLGTLTAAFLFAVFAGQISAETPHDLHIKFENVADSTQGLSLFSQFPAINNRGAVAFVATQSGAGEVLKWEHHD